MHDMQQTYLQRLFVSGTTFVLISVAYQQVLLYH